MFHGICWRDSGDLLIPLKHLNRNQEAESKSQLLGGFGVGSDREEHGVSYSEATAWAVIHKWIQIKCWSPKWDGNVPLSSNNHGSGTGQGRLKNDLLVGASSKFHSCTLDSGCLPTSGNPISHNNTKLKDLYKSEESLKRRGTSLTPSQVFDVWPSEKSEAPASYYYLSKTWIQEPSRWGLRELSACCAPTASGAHFEGCNVSFRSYSRVWISMAPLSWKDQPGRCCY